MKIDTKELRIVFMGTPEISAGLLRTLFENKFNVVAVVAQPDKPVGRKGILQKVPTKVVAEEFGVPVYQPIKIRKDYEFLKEINPDLILTFAYGQIVPEGVLNIPKYGCLNFHGSLLPKYRGAAPIQFSLINNESVTGVTLMEMIKEMDAGKMFASKEVIIEENDNATSLFKKIEVASCELLLDKIQDYVDGKLPGEEQDPSKVTFCPMIKPEEEKINLDLSAKEIWGWIRGLSDEPGAFLYLNGLKIKIFKAKLIDDNSSGNIGEIIKADKTGFVFQTKCGAISILELQKEGKGRMDYKSFLNGNQGLLGKKFE
ncbi:MAG: methionyl-tRNA formyltransferase [Bacilli bacterium]|nr:methionyl-tRNA formyltransferase [Bacilli bacterium]